jgi:hypothetical protein
MEGLFLEKYKQENQSHIGSNPVSPGGQDDTRMSRTGYLRLALLCGDLQ